MVLPTLNGFTMDKDFTMEKDLTMEKDFSMEKDLTMEKDFSKIVLRMCTILPYPHDNVKCLKL